jgi:epoxyqueuosine reductase QueG
MISAIGIQSIHGSIVGRLADGDLIGVGRLDSPAAAPIAVDASGILPGAKSVVVVASEVFPEILDLVTPEKTMGEAAARELYAPHLDYLNGRMNRMLYEFARAYRQAGYRAVPLPSAGTPVDGRFQKGLLSFKGAAVLAGLGMIGQNSLLITPQYGPRVRLACLLTDAELAPAEMLAENPCDGCGDCLKTCPAGALAEPADGQAFSINRFACCAYRGSAGACSTCVQSCPVGRD